MFTTKVKKMEKLLELFQFIPSKLITPVAHREVCELTELYINYIYQKTLTEVVKYVSDQISPSSHLNMVTICLLHIDLLLLNSDNFLHHRHRQRT